MICMGLIYKMIFFHEFTSIFCLPSAPNALLYKSQLSRLVNKAKIKRIQFWNLHLKAPVLALVKCHRLALRCARDKRNEITSSSTRVWCETASDMTINWPQSVGSGGGAGKVGTALLLGSRWKWTGLESVPGWQDWLYWQTEATIKN